MRVGLWRRLVVASVCASIVGGVVIAAFAVEDKKFKYKTIPADINTLPDLTLPDPSLDVKREINAHGGPVLLDGTFTPGVASAPNPLKLVWKLPPGVTLPFHSAGVPELANTTVTKLAITLTGAIDCADPHTDGTPDAPIKPLVGTAVVTYAAINPATGTPFTTKAAVRLGPGHDAAKTDDVAMAGIVTAGSGLGSSFILDGVMRPVGQSWAACQAGTGTVTKMKFATKVDTDGNGDPAPGYYRGGFAMGYGSVTMDGWSVGGRSNEIAPGTP